MSSSRGERAAAPARFAAAVTAARDDARARFEKAITSETDDSTSARAQARQPDVRGEHLLLDRCRRRRRPTETPERPSAKALVHAPAEGAGGVRFVSNDDPTPPGPSDEELGVDAREPPAPSPAMSVAGDGAGSAGEAPASEEDTRPILISSVDFEGESPELEQLARSVVRIKPNFSYTVKEIEADVVGVFNTGVFREVRPETVDTRDGISLTFKLAANPVIRGVVIKGCDELPASYAETLFKPQFGKFLNSTLLIAACSEISRWYDKKKIPVEWYGVEVSDGILELGIEEPRIGDVEIRFIDRKTGEPSAGATRPEYVSRHLKNVKPGKALHGRMLDDLNDLINTAGLENANITWNPRRDRKPGSFLVDAVVNVTEKTSAGFSGGGGISAKGLQEGGLSALIANADYFRRNLFGRCQTLTARVEVSPNNLSSKPEIDVKIQHSDPWIGDAGRTSRRIFLDSDSSALDPVYAVAERGDDALVGDDDAGLTPREDITDTNLGASAETLGTPTKGVFVKRVSSGVEYRRPLAACWTGSVSATYQRAGTHDDLKQPLLHDAYGAPLTFSGLAHDTTCVILMRFVYEGRGKDEAQLVVSAEQAVPVRPEMLAFNRLLVRAQRGFASELGRG